MARAPREAPGPADFTDAVTGREFHRAAIWIGMAVAVALVWLLAQPLLLIIDVPLHSPEPPLVPLALPPVADGAPAAPAIGEQAEGGSVGRVDVVLSGGRYLALPEQLGAASEVGAQQQLLHLGAAALSAQVLLRPRLSEGGRGYGPARPGATPRAAFSSSAMRNAISSACAPFSRGSHWV